MGLEGLARVMGSGLQAASRAPRQSRMLGIGVSCASRHYHVLAVLVF